MKKVLLLAFVAISMVAMTGCTKDNSELIIGKWNVNLANTYEKVTFGDECEIFNLQEEGDIVSAFITFNEEGTVIMSSTDIEGQTYTDGGKYSVEGNNLWMDGANYTILSLDKKKLIFELTETETEEGETFTYTIHYELDKAK